MTRTKNALRVGAATLLAGSLVFTSFQTFAENLDWYDWDSGGNQEGTIPSDQASNAPWSEATVSTYESTPISQEEGNNEDQSSNASQQQTNEDYECGCGTKLYQSGKGFTGYCQYIVNGQFTAFHYTESASYCPSCGQNPIFYPQSSQEFLGNVNYALCGYARSGVSAVSRVGPVAIDNDLHYYWKCELGDDPYVGTSVPNGSVNCSDSVHCPSNTRADEKVGACIPLPPSPTTSPSLECGTCQVRSSDNRCIACPEILIGTIAQCPRSCNSSTAQESSNDRSAFYEQFPDIDSWGNL